MEESLRKQKESVALQVQSIRLPHAVAAAGVCARPTTPAAAVKYAGRLRSDIARVLRSRKFVRRLLSSVYLRSLLRAVISTESAFVPCAISDKGAMGLMQLMPGTATAMGVSNPMDPDDNLRGGVRYLGQLLERYGGDLRLALGAYNAGPALVDRYGAVPPIPETQNYVREILNKLSANPGSTSTNP